ncbi:hypothetical protein KUL156_48160 [Alteromonas sp. KUL156]|nr:hypothetical protein KUL154_56410 [Alteromonas sp. KUL154]GFE02224.1 hypothetical protein KUL156_48160 [Alteromonas sp. KUL156]
MLFSVIASAEEVTISNAKKAEIATLANQICDTMLLYKNFGKPTYVAFEKMVLKYLKKDAALVSDKSLGISNEVAAFWQQYHPYFICTSAHNGYTTPQHVLKRVVDMNVTASFYFEYFLHDKSVNLNAVEWVEGEPETLLDYLDKILADPQSKGLYDLETVRQLRGFVIKTYNGKRACELLDGYHCPETR